MTTTDLPFAQDPIFADMLSYWQSCCRNGKPPSRADIDPLAMPKASLPYVGLTEPVDGGKRFRYRVLGTVFTLGVGIRVSPGQQCIDEVFSQPRYVEHLHRWIREAMAETRPLFGEYQVRFEQSRWRSLRVRRLGMPLRAEGKHPAMLLTVQRWLDPIPPDPEFKWSQASDAEEMLRTVVS